MTTFSAILEQIKNYDKIIIHRHMRPDPDALGSQAGLQAILQHNFPDKTIKITGFDEPTLTWIVSMDTVADEDYDNALVIVTDTANTARIDDKRYLQGCQLIKIDHHPNDEPYGDLVYVDTTASSCSEIIADFALETGLTLTDTAAYLLYAGIIGDTGRFLYPATTSKTLAIASQLRKFDFDFASLARQMESFPYKIAKLQAYVYDNLEIHPTGAARIILSRQLLESLDITDAETSTVVGTPGHIEGVEAWGIFVEQADGHYRVRLRSKSAIINEIAKNHAGGGHPLASGANSYSLEENHQIYKELQEVLQGESTP